MRADNCRLPSLVRFSQPSGSGPCSANRANRSAAHSANIIRVAASVPGVTKASNRVAPPIGSARMSPSTRGLGAADVALLQETEQWATCHARRVAPSRPGYVEHGPIQDSPGPHLPTPGGRATVGDARLGVATRPAQTGTRSRVLQGGQHPEYPQPPCRQRRVHSFLQPRSPDREAAGDLRDLPVTVLSANGEHAHPGYSRKWAEQDELAALSTRGTHVEADDSNHHLDRDKPELVARVITDLVGRVRSAER